MPINSGQPKGQGGEFVGEYFEGLTKREDLYFKILSENAHSLTDRFRSQHYEQACKQSLALADAALKELDK